MILIPENTTILISSNVTPDEMRDKMFDNYLNTQTEFADIIDVTIQCHNADRVCLFNLDAYSVDLDLEDMDTSTIVQSKTVDLSMGDGEYRQWLIEPLYIYGNAQLRIRIYKTGGTAKCGKCGYGLSTELGETIDDVNMGFIDYSVKDEGEYGVYLNQGNWAKLPKLTCYTTIDVIDNVIEDLVNIRGQLAFWEGNQNDTNYDGIRVYGFLEDWKISFNSSIAIIELSIQGVI